MVAMPLVRSVSAHIFEPLKHIHAIPSFIIFSFSQSLQTPTKLFSSAFYSTVKTPISLPPSFETTPVGSFLLNECGFSLHDANSICTRNPDLLRQKSYDKSRQTLFFLRDKGFHEIGVRKLFLRAPKILGLSFQDNVKHKVEFLEKIGLTGQKLSKALDRNPGVISASISRTLKPRVCFLQSVLDSKPDAVVSNPESDKITGKLLSGHSLTVFVVTANPRILTWPPEKILEGLVKDVEEMGIKKGSKAFARVFIRLCLLNRDTFKRKLENLRELGFTDVEIGILIKNLPTLLGLSKDTVKRKLENLRELGFTDEEVRVLINKNPSLLGIAKDKLRQNLMFLVEEWKLPRNFVLSYPTALTYSMEKRLKPRLSVLRDLMIKNNSSKKAFSYSSGYFISMPEKDFQRKVVSKLTA